MASHRLMIPAVGVGVDLLEDGVDDGKIRKVGADLGKLAALGGDFGGGLVAATACHAEHMRPGSSQRHADALAQAGVGTCDHRVFTVQRKEIHNCVHCVFLPFVLTL